MEINLFDVTVCSIISSGEVVEASFNPKIIHILYKVRME